MREQIKLKDKGVEACLRMVVYASEEAWIAMIPSLELSSYGTSPSDAEQALKTALEIYFDFGLEAQTLEEDLLEHHWERVHTNELGVTVVIDNLMDKINTTDYHVAALQTAYKAVG